MSKINVEKALCKELETLNEIIDRKIVRGQSYASEARRHKYVLASLSRMRRESRFAWITSAARSFSTMASFIF